MFKQLVCISRTFLFSAMLLSLSGCATTGALDERDPWEGVNRGVYNFNNAADKYLLNHIANFYNFITPDFIDNGVTNFFDNLRQIPAIANDLLQLKFDKAVNDLSRFMINSSWGLLGFNDVVGNNIPPGEEDFGQTLAHWGVGSGPYIVLPLLGPSSVRDATGFVADIFINPVTYIDNNDVTLGLFALSAVDIKSDLLSARDVIGEAAIDEYEFLKNAFFERRKVMINDGAVDDFPFDE